VRKAAVELLGEIYKQVTVGGREGGREGGSDVLLLFLR